jgi:hypothetical protein
LSSQNNANLKNGVCWNQKPIAKFANLFTVPHNVELSEVVAEVNRAIRQGKAMGAPNYPQLNHMSLLTLKPMFVQW